MIHDLLLTFRRKFAQRLRSPNAARRILMMDDMIPDPLFGAGFPRAFAIVQSMLRAGHTVDLYALRHGNDDPAKVAKLFDRAVKLHILDGPKGLRRFLRRKGHTYDLLFISRAPTMEAYLAAGGVRRRAGSPVIVYDAEAVLTPREAQRHALLGTSWSTEEYDSALKQELELTRAADMVTAVCHREAMLIATALRSPVSVLSHSVAVRSTIRNFDQRSGFLFVGRLTGPSSISPNVDSIKWFITEIMPIVDDLMGADWLLHIAGLVDAAELVDLCSNRVILHGAVEDLTSLYEHCRVFIAPTRFAAGIPLKVIEAMGKGVPCAVTPIIAERLPVLEGQLSNEDPAEQFAKQCERLYNSSAAWHEAREKGIAYVEKEFSAHAFECALSRVLDCC